MSRGSGCYDPTHARLLADLETTKAQRDAQLVRADQWKDAATTAEAQLAERDKPWQEQGIWQRMKDADPVLRDQLLEAWNTRDTALAERDRARDLAAHLEAENAETEDELRAECVREWESGNDWCERAIAAEARLAAVTTLCDVWDAQAVNLAAEADRLEAAGWHTEARSYRDAAMQVSARNAALRAALQEGTDTP